MRLLDSLRRRRGASSADDTDRTLPARTLPDPAKVPERRGSWEEAALTNVDITELVKQQLGTVTPPWKK